MRGLIRPCRTHLGPHLHQRWLAHLCGLCLTLRDEAGQGSRVLTGYDVLLLSVLVEAQAGALPTTQAGPCPLRGFRPATVVSADTEAMQLAAAGALLTGAAGLVDKVDDGDLPAPARPLARRAAAGFRGEGERLAAGVGMAPGAVLDAPAAAATAEAAPDSTLDDLLAPAGAAVAVLFRRTADLAGTPANADLLAAAGEAYGRLVHLLDAVADRAADARAGRFNPLAATGTTDEDARALAGRLRSAVVDPLAAADLVDRELVDALLGPALTAAVRRAFPEPPPVPAARVATFGLAAALSAAAAVFGRPRGRYGRRYDPRYDPMYDPRYGMRYQRGFRGPSCCQILACDACASCACSSCCGGGDDCCICCV